MLPDEVLPAPPLPTHAATIALFLDVDGTLIEFADLPSLARSPPGLGALLSRLRTRLCGALAPVSGRPLDEVDALLAFGDGAAAGLHGAEVRHADGSVQMPSLADPHRAALRSWATQLSDHFPALFIEHKPASLALHYRELPLQAGALRDAVDGFAASLGDLFEVQPGHHVLEIKPRGASKGSAIETLMKEPPFAGRVPWMIGDDFTDEFGFERAIALGGHAVVVGGRRPTQATFALPDPQSLRDWLGALAARIDA